jgi:hypothetical protein
MKTLVLAVLTVITLVGCAAKKNSIPLTCANTDSTKTHVLNMDNEGKYITYDGRILHLRNARMGEGEWNYAFFIGENDELVGLTFNNAKILYRHYSDAKNEDPNSYDEYGGCEKPLSNK